MAATPSQIVVNAVLAATTRVTRRVEIYEQDGKTRWAHDSNTVQRIITGSVTQNGNSESEKRTGECTLDNTDGVLDSKPGGFWYDKIIKVFRGVEYDVPQPKIIIIQDSSNEAGVWRGMLGNFGYTNITVNTSVRTFAQLMGYDIIIALGGWGSVDQTNVTPLLNQLYAAGKAVFTNGNDNSAANVPLITATIAKNTPAPPYSIAPVSGHYASVGWTAEDESSDTGTLPTTLREDAVPVASMVFGATTGYTAFGGQHLSGGRWFHYHDFEYGAQAAVMLRRAFDWLDDTRDRTTSWEMQLGEFMIDEISSQNEPRTVDIKMRDYVKKCKMSEMYKPTTFKKGTGLEATIRALAANAGITKMNLPVTGKKLTRDFVYEPGTARWDVMKDMATAYGYDLFFDNTGTLVMPVLADPAGKTTTFTFLVGKTGNLVAYSKVTNDSRIYNHICVTGQAANQTPVYGEASNNVPGSPTSIAELGDRVYRYESTFITTAAQALATAKSFLARYALEEFDLQFESIVIPWLEAGTVVDFIDPRPSPGDPTRFLLTDITIPLDLGSMSATGKRVRQVLS